ncbi:hypothetical protein LCGC14_2575890, partial [marine sediment metagenome]
MTKSYLDDKFLIKFFIKNSDELIYLKRIEIRKKITLIFKELLENEKEIIEKLS